MLAINGHKQARGPTTVRLRPIVEDGTMSIRTGLSVTIAGHVLSLDRDEKNKVARIAVKVENGYKVTGLETEAVRAAADMLRRRAMRFLGDWKVIGLPNNYATMSSRAG